MEFYSNIFASFSRQRFSSAAKIPYLLLSSPPIPRPSSSVRLFSQTAAGSSPLLFSFVLVKGLTAITLREGRKTSATFSSAVPSRLPIESDGSEIMTAPNSYDAKPSLQKPLVRSPGAPGKDASLPQKPKYMNGPLYMQTAGNSNVVLVRRVRRKDASPWKLFTQWMVENQIGMSMDVASHFITNIAYSILPSSLISAGSAWRGNSRGGNETN